MTNAAVTMKFFTRFFGWTNVFLLRFIDTINEKVRPEVSLNSDVL